MGNTTFGYVNSPSMFGWLTGWYQLKSIGETGMNSPVHPFVVSRPPVPSARRIDVGASVRGFALGLVFLGWRCTGSASFGQQVRISVAGFIVGSWGLMGLYSVRRGSGRRRFVVCALFAIPDCGLYRRANVPFATAVHPGVGGSLQRASAEP